MMSGLLTTKLHRPRPTPNLVARPRLVGRLDDGFRIGHPLFLVVAPAGYGKTTLVTDWLDKSRIPTAWLSLDEADNDPFRFFTYVVAALQQTLGPKLSRPMPEAFPMVPQTPEEFVLPLINDLAADERPIILALDDYHMISDGLVQAAMNLLLRRAPPNLHLAVLTRADPPFPLPRLRVRQRMTEIRDIDLRFTPEEMTAFLNSRHRLNLPAEQIAALESRTEGWAAGVQLAALSLQGCGADRTAQFIDAFSGSHHYIVDYLFEEVLSRQPDALRAFLLRTSILERMCAELCDSVLSLGATERASSGESETAGLAPHQLLGSEAPGRSPAQQVLETLEHRNLFLVPLDDERRWYRYHHLFIDVLRGMLGSASQPDEISGLHSRASAWFRQNGYVSDAVHHALRAGDYEQAAETVEEIAWSMVRQAELALLRTWIEALPGESISGRPWLRIYHAWALFFSESEAAEAQLRAVERQHRGGDGTALSPEMQAHIAAIRAWIAYMRDQPERAVVLSNQALGLSPEIDAAVRSGLLTFLALGSFMKEDLPGCARLYSEAADLARSSGNTMVEVLSRTSLGALRACTGNLREAEEMYQRALETAIRGRSPVAGQAYACLARIYREWNDLASARRYAEKLIESSATWGVADALACGHLFVATILQAQGDVPGANQALAEASEVMRRHPLEMRSMPWLGATRARLWLEQGRLGDARRWAETRGLPAEGKPELRNEIEYLALARILLAERRVDEATRPLLRLQSAMESTGRHGDLVEVLVLRAVALDMQAESGRALAVLEQAVRLARPEGYMRVFLDEGKPVERLLTLAAAAWKDRKLVAYSRKLLAAFAQQSVAQAAGHAPAKPILTGRELEVLQLVAAGCSNQEIANELVIAIGTAKRHTANIFDKLDVRNRTEAVARARELGLL